MRFLPGHDQWVIGPGTKDVHVTPPPRRDAMTRKANPVVVGGVVCGTWAAHRATTLTVTLARRGRRPDAAIRREVERMGVILDRDLRLTS